MFLEISHGLFCLQHTSGTFLFASDQPWWKGRWISIFPGRMYLKPWYYFPKRSVSETGMGLQIFTIPFQQVQLRNINALAWHLIQDQKHHYEDIFSHVVALNLKYTMSGILFLLAITIYTLKFRFTDKGREFQLNRKCNTFFFYKLGRSLQCCPYASYNFLLSWFWSEFKI